MLSPYDRFPHREAVFYLSGTFIPETRYSDQYPLFVGYVFYGKNWMFAFDDNGEKTVIVRMESYRCRTLGFPYVILSIVNDERVMQHQGTKVTT